MNRSGIARRLFPYPEHADTLLLKLLRGLVTALAGGQQAEMRLDKLSGENIALREENARLKNPPPRLRLLLSGMEKAADGTSNTSLG